jgi:hypothetical protein
LKSKFANNGKNNDDFGRRMKQLKVNNGNGDREKYGIYGEAVDILKEENEQE